MKSGVNAAEKLLIDIRQLTRTGAVTGAALNLMMVAGMIQSAIPHNAMARMAFYMALGQYLGSSLEGAALDPELLSVDPTAILISRESA